MGLRFLAALIWLASQCALFAANEPEYPTKDDYQVAANLQNNLEFELAIPQWKEVIAECPDPVRVDKARYHLATCYYYEREFKKSLNQLNIVLNTNPARKDKSKGELRRNVIALMAMNHIQLRNERESKETLALLRSEFPADQELATEIEKGQYPADREQLRKAQKATATSPK